MCHRLEYTNIVNKDINLTNLRYSCLDSVLDVLLMLKIHRVDSNLDVWELGDDILSYCLELVLHQ